MSTAAGRRRAGASADRAGGTGDAPSPRDPGRLSGWLGARSAGLVRRSTGIAQSRAPFLTWIALVVVATALMVCAKVSVGPSWFGDAGAVIVISTFTWALAARTGGRPMVFGSVALAAALAVVLTDDDRWHTGAAVATSVVATVLAVMATVPAVTIWRAVRECLVAVAIAAVGALATVGFEPATTVEGFQYTTFGLALVGAIVLVYRLGAGLHGLGRRGILSVLVGGVVLAGTLLYAELLRRYGATGLDQTLKDIVEWNRDHLGASPRPLEAVLGVPALLYGVHLRARRRQGWWVCAFGVAATSAVANALLQPSVGLREASLAVVYGLVIGLMIGAVLIRLDLAVTGRGTRSRGRRSRVAEQATALRPEPARTAPLL